MKDRVVTGKWEHGKYWNETLTGGDYIVFETPFGESRLITFTPVPLAVLREILSAYDKAGVTP